MQMAAPKRPQRRPGSRRAEPVRDKALRVRCTEAELQDWHDYVVGRTKGKMDFSDWARAAFRFCRDLEQQGRLDLKQDPPWVDLDQTENTVRKLVELLRDADAVKKLTRE